MDTDYLELCSLSDFVTNSSEAVTIDWEMTPAEVSVLSSLISSVEIPQLALLTELPPSPADQLGLCAGMVRTLSLGYHDGLEVKQVPQLLRALAQSASERLEQLSFSNIRLDDEHISDSFSKLAGLRSLSVMALDPSSCSIRSLAPGIRCLHALNSLSIGGIKFSQTDTAILAAALKDLPLLVELRISSAGINAMNVQPIAALIALGKIKKLYLKRNKLGDAGVTTMVDTILASHRRRSELEELNLGENTIGPAGGCKIAELVSRSVRLRALCVSFNKLGEASAEAIGKALHGAGMVKSLEALNVGRCALGLDGITLLLDALRSSPALINVLRMEGNRIGNLGAIKIAQFIVSPGGHRLAELQLPSCDITEVGALELARALVGCYTLRSIHVPETAYKYLGTTSAPEAPQPS